MFFAINETANKSKYHGTNASTPFRLGSTEDLLLIAAHASPAGSTGAATILVGKEVT